MTGLEIYFPSKIRLKTYKKIQLDVIENLQKDTIGCDLITQFMVKTIFSSIDTNDTRLLASLA